MREFRSGNDRARGFDHAHANGTGSHDSTPVTKQTPEEALRVKLHAAEESLATIAAVYVPKLDAAQATEDDARAARERRAAYDTARADAEAHLGRAVTARSFAADYATQHQLDSSAMLDGFDAKLAQARQALAAAPPPPPRFEAVPLEAEIAAAIAMERGPARNTTLVYLFSQLDRASARVLKRRLENPDSEDKTSQAFGSVVDARADLLGILAGTKQVRIDPRKVQLPDTASATAPPARTAGAAPAPVNIDKPPEYEENRATIDDSGNTAQTSAFPVSPAPAPDHGAAPHRVPVNIDKPPEYEESRETQTIDDSGSAAQTSEPPAPAPNLGAAPPVPVNIDKPPEYEENRATQTIDDSGGTAQASGDERRDHQHAGGRHSPRNSAPRDHDRTEAKGDAKQAPEPPPNTDSLSPEAAFLRALTEDNIAQSPHPLMMERGTRGLLTVQLGAPQSPLDVTAAPITVRWRLTDRERSVITSGEALWFAGAWAGPFLVIPLDGPADRWIEVEFDAGAKGHRRLTKMLAIRTPDLNTLRNLTDEELQTEGSALDSQIATETDPALRDTALQGKREMEWLASERGLDQEGQGEDPDLWTLTTDPIAVRRMIERYIVNHGIEQTSQDLYGASYVFPPEVIPIADQQFQLLVAERDAFAATVRETAFDTALKMLNESEAEIGSTLSGYGLFAGKEMLDLAAKTLILKGDDTLDIAVEMVMHLSQQGNSKNANQREDFAGAASQREALVTAVRDLKDLQNHVGQLRDQRDTLDTSNPPPPARPANDDDPSMLAREQVAALDIQLKAAQQDLSIRWLEHERAHPILVAFRSREGEPNDVGALLGDQDALMRGVLRGVLPKVKNIHRCRGGLGDDVHPMELPPVVALTKQRLHVAPGSFRDRIVRDEVEDASSDWKAWAIGAVTLGLAVLTAIPSGGSSLVLGAEIAALSLDAYLAMDAVNQYSADSAAANTNLDLAGSLSQEEPSLIWLAVQLVALPLDAMMVARAFREAVDVTRAVRSGERVNEAAVRHLDSLGAEHEMGAIGQRVLNEAGASEGSAGATLAGAGARRAAHPLFADVAGDLAASNTEALARRLGVPVELDDSLGTGVVVDWVVHDNEHVQVIAVRAGHIATTADVLAHGRTMQLLRRYNGAWGRLRRMLDDLLAVFQGGAARPGSEAFKARYEFEKLRRIAGSRREAMLASIGDASVLEREALFLEEQAAQFEAIAQSANRDAVAGAHETAMPDTSRISGAVSDAETRSKEILEEFAERQRGGFDAATEELETAFDLDDIDNLSQQRRGDRAAVNYPGRNARTGDAAYFPPKSAGPEFDAWFDTLSDRDFAKLWDDEAAHEAFASALRGDGGNHEWLMVVEARKIKAWGVPIGTVKSAVTRTDAIIGRLTTADGRRIVFRHGGTGSHGGTFHKALQRMIKDSNDYGAFLTKLNHWADESLGPISSTRWPDAPKLGRYSLPDDLQLRGEGGIK